MKNDTDTRKTQYNIWQDATTLIYHTNYVSYMGLWSRSTAIIHGAKKNPQLKQLILPSVCDPFQEQKSQHSTNMKHYHFVYKHLNRSRWVCQKGVGQLMKSKMLNITGIFCKTASQDDFTS